MSKNCGYKCKKDDCKLNLSYRVVEVQFLPFSNACKITKNRVSTEQVLNILKENDIKPTIINDKEYVPSYKSMRNGGFRIDKDNGFIIIFYDYYEATNYNIIVNFNKWINNNITHGRFNNPSFEQYIPNCSSNRRYYGLFIKVSELKASFYRELYKHN